MAVYNSSIGSPHDDSDITIIHPSILNEPNDEYVNNTQKNDEQVDNNRCKNEYIFVDHNPQENAKQLEQILQCYIRDLKQESNTQLDCNQQLIIRMMNLIRPTYSTDQKKMIELDKVMEEIASLHDKRHIEQKEKIEQLRTEICQLQKMLIIVPNDQSTYDADDNRTYSIRNTMYRTNSMDERWTEIEHDTKKLHEIVQSQRNQINEIVTLVSETAIESNNLNTTEIPNNKSENTVADQPVTPTRKPTVMSTLLKKIQNITGHHHEPTSPTTITETTTLENHSPGISPSQSFNTLTIESLKITPDNQAQEPEISAVSKSIIQKPMFEEPHTPIAISISPPASSMDTSVPTPASPIDTSTPVPNTPTEPKRCPVCNHEFASESEDVEMYDHIEKCLFPSLVHAQPKDYECPICNRKLPGDDESAYLQHLSDCYNREI